MTCPVGQLPELLAHYESPVVLLNLRVVTTAEQVTMREVRLHRLDALAGRGEATVCSAVTFRKDLVLLPPSLVAAVGVMQDHRRPRTSALVVAQAGVGISIATVHAHWQGRWHV